MTSITFTTAPPSARVIFSSADLFAKTETITAYRVIDGVSTTVRSAVRIFAVGGALFDDAEVPVGVTVEYRAQQFDGTGKELGFTQSASVLVPGERGVGWVSDPLDASSAVRVVLAESAGRLPRRPVPGAVYRVGARTVALVGSRGLLQDLPMDFYTETTADRQAIWNLIGATGGLLLFRTPPPVPIPRLLYAWAANATFDDFDPYGGEGSVWSNTVQEITPTDAPLVVGAAPWQAYINAFPTWADFNAAYLTWFDALKSPPEV